MISSISLSFGITENLCGY